MEHNSVTNRGAELQHSVLLIAPQPFFVNRGTPINVRAMAEVLAEGGYQVDLLVYPFGETINLPGVTIIRSPKVPVVKAVAIGPSWPKILIDVFLSLYALRLCLSKRYDVIHGVEEGGFVAGVLSALRRTPYIFDMDSCMVDQLKQSGFITNKAVLNGIAAIEAFFVRRADAVLTVCSALTEKARKLNPTAYISQIEDFPLQSSTDGLEQLKLRLTEQFKLTAKKVLLYTGNLEHYQGIELLLDAFAELAEGTENLLLLIVGGQGLEDVQIKNLRTRASALNLNGKVVFTGGRPPHEMQGFMELADVLLSPRISGSNTPLKIYSYMAAGRPIVATRIESHTQVLSDGSAYLAAAEVNDFAAALKAAISETEEANAERVKRVAAARRLIEEKYNRKEFARRLLELYRKVLNPCSEESLHAEKSLPGSSLSGSALNIANERVEGKRAVTRTPA